MFTIKRWRFLFVLTIFIVVFSFSTKVFGSESFVNITSGLTFSNPSVGKVCGLYPDSFNTSVLYVIKMYRDTYPGTANIVVNSAMHSVNSALSNCPGSALESGFWNGAANTSDGSYWIKMTSTGFPYLPDWINSISYYFEATRSSGVWSLVPVGTCSDGIQNQDETGIDVGGVCGDIVPPPPVGCVIDCFSNVLFLPGLEASRLYTQRPDGSEDQFWEPNGNSDVEVLYLNPDGTSKNADIYTRDIIKETNTPIPTGPAGQNIYKSFSDMMD